MVPNSTFSFICIAETYSFETIFLLCFPLELGVICLVLEASSPPFLELLLLEFLLPAELLPLLGPVIRDLLLVDWLTVLWDVAVLDFLSDENEDWVNSSSSSDPSNASSSRSSSSSACHDQKKKSSNILLYFKIYS